MHCNPIRWCGRSGSILSLSTKYSVNGILGCLCMKWLEGDVLAATPQKKRRQPLIHLPECSLFTGQACSCRTPILGLILDSTEAFFTAGSGYSEKGSLCVDFDMLSSLFFKWNFLPSGKAQRAEFAIGYLMLNLHNLL